MSTLEKLFVQIFDRRRWIVDQVKQQSDLFDQYLASQLLINGIRPPSCLLSSGFDGGSAEFKELKKEDLISGLLFPPPRPNHPSTASHNMFYHRPSVTGKNVHSSDVLFAGTCDSDKFSDVGDRTLLVPEFHFNDREHEVRSSPKVVPEQNPAFTSPPGQEVSRMPDSNLELDQSLAGLKRSRSRQKALELRSSVKSGADKDLREGQCNSEFSGRITRSRTCNEQSADARELLEQQSRSNTKNEGCFRVTRSRSGTHLIHSVEKPFQLSISKNGGDNLHNALDSAKSDKSQNVPSGRVAFSRSTSEKVPSSRVSRSSPSNKHSQSDTQSEMVERHEVRKAIDTPLIPVAGNDLDGILHPENFNGVVPDTEFVSSLPAEAFSNCLGSDMGNDCRVEEFSVSSPPAEDEIFVEPKQLFFDEIEDCSLNGRFTPHSDKEKENGSKGKTGSVGPTASLRKVIGSSEVPEKYDAEILERDRSLEVMNSAKKLRDSSDGQDNLHNTLHSAKSEIEKHSIAGEIPRDFPGRFTRSRSSSDVKSAQLNDIETPGRSAKRRKTESCESSRKSETKEGDGDMNGGETDIDVSLGFNQTCTKSLNVGESENVHDCLLVSKDIDATQLASDHDQNMLFPGFQKKEELGSIEGASQDTKPVTREQLFSHCSASSTDFQDSDLIAANQFIPESEGFSIGLPSEQILSLSGDKISIGKIDLPPSTTERIIFLERLCRSAGTLTPQSLKHKIYRTPDEYHSLPNGLLERIGLRNTLPFSDEDSAKSEIEKHSIVGKSPCDFPGRITRSRSSSDVKAAQLNVIETPGRSAKRRKTESYKSSWKSETKEGDGDMNGGETGTDVSLGFNQTCTMASLDSILNMGESENTHDCLLGSKDIDATQLAPDHDKTMLCPGFQKKEELGFIEGALQDTKSVTGEQLFSHCSASSTDFQDSDLIAANRFSPEFEGFSIGLPSEQILSLSGVKISIENIDLPTSTTERISYLERLCRSTSTLTPLPQSSKHKIHRTPDVYQSLPNGLLERIDLRNTLPFSDEDLKQLKASYTLTGAESDLASYSGCIPSSSVQLDLGVGLPPCTPPVRRLGQRTVPGHTRHSLEKQHSVNPELTCFRIDEDTSTSEEDMIIDEVADASHDGISPRNSISSSHRRPLGDLSNSKVLPLISVAKVVHERGSLDSLNTDQNMSCTQNNAKQKLRSAYGKDRTKKDIENQSSSLRGNGVGKVSESFRNTTQKLSRKASEGRKPQRANIVSNVSSFIPLVQQKQQPSALITGKRDVKVKALETAEAAKRLEEKRENERKLKKEAAKLKRARMEEERNKQLEIKEKKKEEERKKKEADVAAQLERARLEEERSKPFEMKQKKKEEERKKKEADVAARKRHREEEDRKEKERKRRCIEEARRQQKEQDKLCAEKEEKEQRRRHADEREGKKKYLLKEEHQCQKPAKESKIDECTKEMETGSRVVNLAVENAIKASDICDNSEVLEGYHDEVVRNSSESSNCGFSFTEGCGEQSYEISPYQVSDDEEEEEEDLIPNKKFIPSWAREKQLALVLPSLEQINPFEIFLPTKCCSISEVLLSRMDLK